MPKNKTEPNKPIVLQITAKCSDMFGATLSDGRDYDGYVPDWFPNKQTHHFGDYVQLDIDLETGQILNWKKPSKTELDATFKKE